MNIEAVIKALEDVAIEKMVRFVSSKGTNCCPKCLQYHGKIFKEDDPDKPTLPIHPHCQCKYEPVENPRLKKVKENVSQIIQQLQSYAEKALARALELIAKAKSVIEEVKSSQSKIKSAVLTVEIPALIIELESVLASLNKLKSVTQTLLDAMHRLGWETANPIEAAGNFSKVIIAVEETLKELHYCRLKDPSQDIKMLPQSPEEAEKRGFVKAPDKQNRYHRNKGETGNVKYYNPVTGQEVVFDKNGKIVTTPENIGTKNYGPDPVSRDHVIYDVLPYWIWGNSEEDTTPLWGRIWGSGK